ncbi:MAG: hypothetical protein ABI199_06155 [Bacteroidia bacterium]
MKKIIATTFVCFLLLTSAQGQTISKKDAKQFLEKAWSYLKTSDSTSFVKLWALDASAPKHKGRTFSSQDIIENFDMMKGYLDTALIENLKIDYIEVEKDNLKGTDSEYWIKAWFKYDEHDYKGFGFYIAYKNSKWVVRDNPSTSTMKKN